MKEETIRKICENFMEEFKDYIIDFDIIWTDNYLQCKNFIENNKRRPISCSKNKEERQLGNWIIQQNINYKNKKKSMKDNCKRMLWENFLKDFKEYLKTDDEIWDETLKKLKLFININKKIPTIKEEKQLTEWVYNQKARYKNNENSMKGETRRKIWENFMEEFKEYFD